MRKGVRNVPSVKRSLASSVFRHMKQWKLISEQQYSIRASALRVGGHGFDPRPGHTKDYKNGTQFLPAWRSASTVGLGCAVSMWLSAYRRHGAAWRRRGFDSRARRPLPHLPPIALPLSCQSTVLSIKIKAKKPKK